MTLEIIEESLPNGLHDAQILDIAVSYESMQVVIGLNILVGTPLQPIAQRSCYRRGKVVFGQLRFLAIEPPEPSSPFQSAGGVWFSYERTPAGVLRQDLLNTLPDGALCYSLFIRDWLASIHIASDRVDFSWDSYLDESTAG